MYRLLQFILFLIPIFLPTEAIHRTLLQNGTVSARCPLNFDVLRRLVPGSGRRPALETRLECQYTRQGLRLVLSEYLRLTNNFLPPISAAESCWDAYERLLDDFAPSNFDARRRCGFETSWISAGCMNITTRSEFEKRVPQTAVSDVVSSCSQSLLNNAPCASCITAMSRLQASYLAGPFTGNLSDCTAFPLIYVAAFVNHFGPTDPGTAKCIFNLDFSSKNSNSKTKTIVISVVAGVLGGAAILGFFTCWYLHQRKSKFTKWGNNNTNMTNPYNSGLDSISESTSLIRFTFEEIKAATRNFSRNNIIGKGGYGNVYKGVLPDGTEVALKRFKNCSAAGDSSFTHEVEVIASVRHVNLVALRGYCTATTPLEGHQRIIVCDLMKNGSVYDHLFSSDGRKLSWPIRQKIALGTAKGLEYLHYGAQPGIIHRDIKASNILLDEKFEAKVADFGLAKFAPQGVSHLSTRVAGTMGYVAPEYALYGQLTERSDVYSFGVVLLEILSGKKALMAAGNDEAQPTLVTDWAWSMVRKGRAMDVVESGMAEMGDAAVVEKYVLVAVLCSHPQLYARPTMDQVVKMLDVGLEMPVPSIPDRPISLIANMEDIERSVNSSESGRIATPAGYQAYTQAADDESLVECR